jgi:streptogrisin C
MRSSRRHWLIVVGIVGVIIAAQLTTVARRAVAATPTAEPALGHLASTADDVVARRELGFRSDTAYVSDLVTRAAARDNSVDIIDGLAFTPKEAAEFQARLQLQDYAGQVSTYGSQHSNNYAGMYIDQLAGGVLVARFTGDLAQPRRELRATFAMPGRLLVTSARWSLKDLEGVAALVQQRRADLGTPLVSIAIDVETNTVKVGVIAVTPAARQFVSANFPNGMVVLSAVPAAHLATEVVGGSRLFDLTRSTECTASFSYRATNGYGFFTAGHCGLAGDHIQVFSQNFTAYGSYFVGYDTDSMAIPAPYADTTNQSGWVIVNSASNGNDDPQGTFVCDYGATTGTQRCGTVTTTLYTVYYCDDFGRGCGYVFYVREVYMGQCGDGPIPGDSGAPVYGSSGKAYGILEGSSNTDACPASNPDLMTYTSVAPAMSMFGVTIPR